MSNVGGKLVTNFRRSFTLPQKKSLLWFPGHMNTGLNKMQQRLKNIDLIIEVHDARVPISGRYADFRHVLLGVKPHIFVLNKTDLADTSYRRSITDHLKKEGLNHVLFTNLKNQHCNETKKILPLAKDLISNCERYNRITSESYAIMVIGVPNVGKSSLINRLRNMYLHMTGASAVGAIAGVTRAVLTRIKISENPNVYLYDTPGILTPFVKDIDTGLKLALIGCLQDHIVGHETLADYLLFWLNRHENFEYVDVLGLKQPNDSITYVLTFIAAKLKKTLRVKSYSSGPVQIVPDLASAAKHFIHMYRTGRLGKICLDEDLLRDGFHAKDYRA